MGGKVVKLMKQNISSELKKNHAESDDLPYIIRWVNEHEIKTVYNILRVDNTFILPYDIKVKIS
jgi:oligoribonuclease (3'-5' exoribonuclease)